MKTVLITGIAGFLGGHVADYFIEQGWKVIGIDNLTEFELTRAKFDIQMSREHNLKFLKEIGVDFRKLDCRYVNPEDFAQDNLDFIIHCAAQPAMTIAIEFPKYDADDNIMSVVNMLEIAKYYKIPFVNCSTIHVYGNKLNDNLIEKETRFENEPKEIDEGRPILVGDLTPLHVSKRATELYAKSYGETYGLRTASFRLTGMYGERQFGGQDHGWVANFAIRTILNRPIIVFGTDKQVRDILYAKDAARAFYMWYEKGSNDIFNIGAGYENSISLGECLNKIKEITNTNQDIKIEPKRFGDLYYFVCDHKKATEDFGWKPEINIETGLNRICNWITYNKELFI